MQAPGARRGCMPGTVLLVPRGLRIDIFDSPGHAHRRTPLSSGKRGTVSRAQKRRRLARLEKGMAHAARVDAKAMKLSSSKASRKALKGLWQCGKDDGK